jgi:large subunit ribosomal protein L31
MKKDIHPKYYPDAKVTCVCGNSFTTGSTMPEIKIEICSACHPFYTGKQKLVDTARRVDKFQKRAAQATDMSAVRKGKKQKQAVRAAKRAKGEVTVKAKKEDKK